MSAPDHSFPTVSRILHWLMAILIIAMLFIGIAMVSTISPWYPSLVSIHKPLGVAILVLVILRLANRLRRGTPPLPADLPAIQRVAAGASHVALYLLMFALPVVGWAMLSAGHYPIVLFGPVQLPPIAPASPALYATLRTLHTVLAYSLFVIVLVHLAAALFHGLIRRDGVLRSMVAGSLKK